MNDKTSFKKTIFHFHQEANILLRSDFDECPRPFKRFLEQIEAEPVIKSYLDDCVDNHLPDGFDAAATVKAVMDDYGSIFGNFSTDPMEESAQVYLILKEIVAQNVQGRSVLFYGYAPKNYADMYKGFMDKVARKLITNLDGYLSLMGIEMGLDDGGSVNNTFNGPINNAQLNQAAGSAVVNATQANNVNTEELDALIKEALAAADGLDDDIAKDVHESLELVRSEMGNDKPKRSIVKGALTFLKSVDASAQFTAAIVQICEFVMQSGMQLPL